MLGGRGAGKTRAGAEWVRGLRRPAACSHRPGRIALVGETFADVREVMIEGVSGLLAVHARGERPEWQPTRRRLVWPNGAVAQAFSAEDPEALRGPQFGAAWADELAKWRHAEATWDMLQFGLRLGDRPRQVVTTTPRPIPLLRRLIADAATASTAVSRATTADNAINLAPGFLEPRRRPLCRHAARPAGAGRRADRGPRRRALAARRRSRRRGSTRHPPLGRIVVAVDPPASQRSGICGIVAAGLGRRRHRLCARRRDAWPRCGRTNGRRRRSRLYRRLDADALVAEVNQGGDMVEAVMREVDARRAGDQGAGDAGQVAARRAGGGALCAGPGAPCRRAAGAGGRDVRLRPRRPVGRAARPTGSTRWSGRSPR